MYRQFLLATMFVPALFLLSMSGCGGSTTSTSNSGVATVEPGHEHAHASAGPHGGTLVELGNEEYHAELVHDEQAGTVTIYVLDSAAKTSVPIDAAELTINLKHEAQGEQFKLAASPDPGDPAGKSSRFVSSDAELAEDLDHEDASPELVMRINGKQYRGAVEHDHRDEGVPDAQHNH